MKIEIEKQDLDSLLQVYCQFLIEEGQHNNLRKSEREAISKVTKISYEEVTSDLILSLSGYSQS